MAFSARLVSGLIFLATLPSASMAGGEPYALTQSVDVVGLSTDCSAASGCAIHIEASIQGRAARSLALPFRSLSAETEAFSEDDWFVGREEKSVRVSVSDAGGGALLVRQEAGHDHPKTAFTLLVPDESGLRTIETWRTGAGPASLLVQSVNGRITVERRMQDATVAVENWQLDRMGQRLMSVQ